MFQDRNPLYLPIKIIEWGPGDKWGTMISPTEGVSVGFYLVGVRVRPARSALNLQISARRNCVESTESHRAVLCFSARGFKIVRSYANGHGIHTKHFIFPWKLHENISIRHDYTVIELQRDFCHRLPSVRADCMMVFSWMSLTRVSTARKCHDSRRLYSPSEMHQHAGIRFATTRLKDVRYFDSWPR